MPRPLRWSPPTEPFTLDDVAPLGVTRPDSGAPEPQVRIETEVGPAWPDFLFRDAMVIVEVDGKVKYRDDPDALVREKLRQEALEKLGYVVIRWMAEDVWPRPAELVDRLRRVLAARGGV